jgi:iron complex outermembrane receptor protein
MRHPKAKRAGPAAMSTVAATILLSGLLQLGVPSALADPVPFNIPPQNLATALNSFASQSHIQVTVAPGLENRQSSGVSGTMEPADALRQLIGPQLSAEFIDPKTVVIKLPDKSSSAARPAQPTGDSGMEEVVVTARRRAEKLQTVPLAVTAFTQATLEKQQIHEIRDLARYVPSVGAATNQSDANAPFSDELRLRGLPGTEIYFAEVPLGNADYQIGSGLQHGLSQGSLYDLEDVEIIKGPQGTLFGKNSVGGLISIQPKRPTDNFEGYLRTSFGNYADKEVEGAVNIPVVTDKLLVRIAGQMQQRDGYTQDLTTGKDLDNANYYAWRIGVTLRPTDDFHNYFLYDGYWQDTNGTGTIASFVNPNFVFGSIPLGPGLNLPLTLGRGPAATGLFNPATAAATAAAGIAAGGVSLYPNISALFAEQRRLGARAVIGDGLQGIGKDYFYGFTDVATWDVSDALTIKNIAAARVFKQLSTDDFTPIGDHVLYIGVPGNNQQWQNNEAQYTEELQFQGKAISDKLTWVAGGFLEYDHPIGDSVIASSALTDTFVGAPSFSHYRIIDRSQAVFVHGDYDLGDYVEGLKFTAGYRYTWDFVSAALRGTSGVNAVMRDPTTGLPNCTGVFLTDSHCYQSATDAHFSASGWNLSLEEQLTPQILLYVRSGNAYRPGGSNLNVPADFASFGPEHITDVEFGVKADWDLWGVHGRTNADVFHSDYQAIQVLHNVSFINPNTNTILDNQLTSNAAAATIDGVELEATIVPVKGVEISPHFSYIHPKYSQYPTVFSVRGADTPFIYEPNTQYGVTGTYHLPIDESWGDVAVSATYSWYGHQYVSTDVDEAYQIMPSYEDIDLRVDWTNVLGRPFDVAFFMTNATDNLHAVGAVDTYPALGFSSLVYNPPRMYGFTLKYRFGGPPEPEAEPAAYTPPAVQPVAPAAPRSYLVFFDFNKSDLTPQARGIVGQAAANAGPAKVTRLTVTGHTDTVGSDAYNMRLSRRRAESVAAELEKDGVASSEIEIVAKGKRDLLVPTGDGVREPQNRRVQIVYDGGVTS